MTSQINIKDTILMSKLEILWESPHDTKIGSKHTLKRAADKFA